MKYVAGMANCFDGQWIVLREIRNVRTAGIDGRCRCAIQLDAIRYSFEDHPELFKEEWGWSDAHAEGAEEREENKHHAAVWYAHQILAVKLMSPPVFLAQSYQGRYWKLKTEDAFMEEAATLLHALASGTFNPCSNDLLIASQVRVTRELVRKQNKKRKHMQREEEKGDFFSFVDQRVVKYQCCKHACAEHYGCSKNQFDEGESQAPLFKLVRKQYHAMDRAMQREVLGARMVDAGSGEDGGRRRLYLEDIRTIHRHLRQSTFPITPEPGTLRLVCHRFFMWAFAISNNKIYQPTHPQAEFSVELSGRRVRSWYDLGASDFIVTWLKDYAEGHLHDPSADSVIILYVSTRAQVYAQYESEFNEGKRNEYYPVTCTGDMVLPSKPYFFRVWRNHPDLKKIVLRKFMKFALCSDCTRIREQRRNCSDPVQRQQLALASRAHHTYVREERASYYFRRHQAIHARDEFLSIIIDGADQAAYALPHLKTRTARHTG